MKIGYLRVSTEEQKPDRQIDALSPVCDELHIEKLSATAKSRPIYEKVIGSLRDGDVFVIWEPKVIDVDADEEFTYSVDLTWTSEKPAAVIKEWVGNFVGTPVAYNITNTSDGLPVELTKTATSATITNRTFDGSMFPGEIGRYHFQITGLEPGEIVTFSKLATGGHVVPEPASLTLCLAGFAAVMLGWGRTR